MATLKAFEGNRSPTRVLCGGRKLASVVGRAARRRDRLSRRHSLDDAPTKGFENILGRRTTYRVASCVCRFRGCRDVHRGEGYRRGASFSPRRKGVGCRGGYLGGTAAQCRRKFGCAFVSHLSVSRIRWRSFTSIRREECVDDDVNTVLKMKQKQKQKLMKKEVPVSLVRVFFAMHSCDEVHVYGFAPPGAERHVRGGLLQHYKCARTRRRRRWGVNEERYGVVAPRGPRGRRDTTDTAGARPRGSHTQSSLLNELELTRWGTC